MKPPSLTLNDEPKLAERAATAVAASKRIRTDKRSGTRTETASVRIPITETRDSTPAPGERRTFEVTNLRTEKGEDGNWRVYGHAAVFDSPSKPMRTKSGKVFVEKIAPGAFKRSLESGRDIAMFDDHDPKKILARTSANTLKLNEDERGLAFEATLADTTIARDLIADIEHRNKTGVSFGFGDPEDKWAMEGSTPVRTLVDVPLGEVSPTAFPAYTATDISVRSEQAAEMAIARLDAGEKEVRCGGDYGYGGGGVRGMAESCRSMCRRALDYVHDFHESLRTVGRPLNDHEKRALNFAHEEAGRLRSRLKDLRSHIRDEYMDGEADDEDEPGEDDPPSNEPPEHDREPERSATPEHLARQIRAAEAAGAGAAVVKELRDLMPVADEVRAAATSETTSQAAAGEGAAA